MKFEVAYRLPVQYVEVEADDEVDLDVKIPYIFDGLEVEGMVIRHQDDIQVIGIREKE